MAKPQGDGTISEAFRQNGKSFNPKHWRVRVDFGKDPITGKRKMRTCTVVGTKADARKARDAMRQEAANGLKADADKLTFREMCAIHMKARMDSASVQERRIKQDQSRLDCMCLFIGDMYLRDITIETVESLYPAIRRHKQSLGYSCKNSTLKGYHTLLKSVLKRAVRFGYIMRNPCDFIEPLPSQEAIERKSLTAEEAHRLLMCINRAEADAIADLKAKEARQKTWGHAKDRSYLYGVRDVSNILVVRVGLATGMRLGEILGRTWSDFSGTAIVVPRTGTKTDSGARRITLDDLTIKHLLEWKKFQATLLHSIDIEQTEDTPIFCSGIGAFTDTANYENWWRKWREANGFPGLLFHELRHTQATQLLGHGIDIKTVQARLGHSDPSLTLKYYAHAIPDNDEKAASLIGDLFQNPPKPARIIPIKTA